MQIEARRGKSKKIRGGGEAPSGCLCAPGPLGGPGDMLPKEKLVLNSLRSLRMWDVGDNNIHIIKVG